MKNSFVSLFILLLSAPVSAAPGPLEANLFVSLSKKLVPSVVNISTYTKIKGRPPMFGGPDDMLRKFFEDMLRQRQGERNNDENFPPSDKNPKNAPKAMALGTGFIIESSGLILTNNHVVAEADEISVTFTEEPDEKPTAGEVVGRDPELDVALIQVKTKRSLSPVIFGDSDALEVGEYVMAIGNPYGQGHSVTHGIISAKGRMAPDVLLANYLQTDAPINPGNSGGPLVNLKGEVIGINNAIDQRAQGIGFAIPINLVKKILPQLKLKGSVSRGYIGVIIQEASPEIAKTLKLPKNLTAPIVSQVIPGEPADKAGLKAYDVILEFNGNIVRNQHDLIMQVTAVPVGESAKIKILRGGKEKTLSINVAKRPVNGDEDKLTPAKKKKPKTDTPKEERIDTGMILEDLTPETAKDLNVTPNSSGVIIADLAYGGPAHHAGLMRGDLILEVDQKTIKNTDSFYAIVKEKKSYLLRVKRLFQSGEESFAVVVLDLKD